MLNRCESRSPRPYTELCNRSSCGGGSPWVEHLGSPMQSSFEILEDYWEDASVSLQSQHSWEAPSNPWLGATNSHVTVNEEAESKKFTGLGSNQIRPHRHTLDVNEYSACMKGRRSFPPPLASCSTLSIKEGGRFVLKEMDVGRPHGFFRAQRGNGRLRLQLVLRDEVNDDDDEDENSSSADEGTVESRLEFFDDFGHVKDYVNDEGTIIRSDQLDVGPDSVNDEGTIIRSNQLEQVSCDEEDIKSNAVGVEGMDVYVCSTLQDVGTEVRCLTLQDAGMDEVGCAPSQDVGAELGCLTSDQSQVVGGLKDLKLKCEQVLDFDGFYAEPRRENSTGRKEADYLESGNFLTIGKCELSASLSPWSPKQLCLHPSIVSMRPAFGLLAIS